MQKCRIRRQIVEIELHVRFYSNMLIRRSNFAIFYAGFCDSARDGGAPSTLGCAPIDAFDQHRRLRWRQRHGATWIAHSGPDEATLIDALGKQAESVAVPEQDFQSARIPAAEGKTDGRRTDPS